MCICIKYILFTPCNVTSIYIFRADQLEKHIVLFAILTLVVPF